MDALRRRPREPEDGSDVIGLAVGVLGSLGLSVAMIPLRDHLHNDNMALALVVRWWTITANRYRVLLSACGYGHKVQFPREKNPFL